MKLLLFLLCFLIYQVSATPTPVCDPNEGPVILDFVMLEFFLYGFIGTIFLGAWVPGTIQLLLLTTIAWYGVFREAPDATSFNFHLYPNLLLVVGIFAGVAFLGVYDFPKLVHTDVYMRPDEQENTKQKRKYNLTPVLLWFFALSMTYGYYYLSGRIEDGCGTIDSDLARNVGISAVVIGAGAFVAIVVWNLIDPYDAFNRRQDLKYLFFAAAFITTPVIYDYLDRAGFDQYHGLVLIATKIILWFLFYYWIGYVSLRSYKNRCCFNTYLNVPRKQCVVPTDAELDQIEEIEEMKSDPDSYDLIANNVMKSFGKVMRNRGNSLLMGKNDVAQKVGTDRMRLVNYRKVEKSSYRLQNQVDRFQNRTEAGRFVALAMAVDLSTTTAGYITDVLTGDEVWPVVVAMAASGGFWFLLFVIWGNVRTEYLRNLPKKTKK